MRSSLHGEKKGSRWLMMLAMVGIAVGYVGLVFYPCHRAISAMQEEIEVRQKVVDRAAEDSPVLVKTEEKLEQVERYVMQWKSQGPNAESLPVLMGRIHSQSKGTGATITQFDPQPSVEIGDLDRVPVSLGGVGSFSQLYKMLGELESLPETIWINSVRFSKSGQSKKSVVCEINMAIFSDNSINSN